MNQKIVEEYKLKWKLERERERAQWCEFRDRQNFLAEMKNRKKRENIKCDYGLDRNCLIECVL